MTQLLAALLIVLFAYNHAILIAGPLVWSGLARRGTAIAVTALGYLAGYATISGFMAPIVEPFMDSSLYVIVSSLATYIVGNLLDVPIPISFAIYSSIAALALADTPNLSTVLAMWVLSPLASMIVAPLIYAYLSSRVDMVRASHVFALPLMFGVAYSIGGNNIGLIAPLSGLAPYLVMASIVAGTMLAYLVRFATIGYGLYSLTPGTVLVASTVTVALTVASTLMSVPMTMTLLVIFSLLGIAYSKSLVLIGRRAVKRLCLGMALGLVLPLVLGVGIRHLLLFPGP